MVRVIDGDTVVIDGIGVGETDRATGGRRARLIGVDTPEISGGAECYGSEAASFTRRELRGERVLVEFDVERTDRYDRALVYLWMPDGVFFNALLAAEGYAQQLTVPPNVEYADLFTKLVRQAREADLGLWGGCPTGTEGTADTGGGDGGTSSDRDCSDFSSQEEAPRFFEQEGGPEQDPHRLDADNDGIACEALDGGEPSPTSAPGPTPAPTPTPTPTPTAAATPEPTPESEDCHPSYRISASSPHPRT